MYHRIVPSQEGGGIELFASRCLRIVSFLHSILHTSSSVSSHTYSPYLPHIYVIEEVTRGLQHTTVRRLLVVVGLSNTLQFLHRTLPIGEFDMHGRIAE